MLRLEERCHRLFDQPYRPAYQILFAVAKADDAIYFADFESLHRQLIGSRLAVDNLTAPDTQLVLAGEVHHDRSNKRSAISSL
jgi:hypothetical protein